MAVVRYRIRSVLAFFVLVAILASAGRFLPWREKHISCGFETPIRSSEEGRELIGRALAKSGVDLIEVANERVVVQICVKPIVPGYYSARIQIVGDHLTTPEYYELSYYGKRLNEAFKQIDKERKLDRE